ncbi:PqqD family protein [Clostridiaceae bacterium NSJ-31]|uniref:PqqD family protein n=1 Tax=Ligaoa zhengdingensis TaxID=2763658 RepID=A0A926I2W1_9FIRM|nr:PqqD family protein [Ligaoa zhengdingensis]MBC8545704.1 PqqD family protein [Ligaoa zhengdingensis]
MSKRKKSAANYLDYIPERNPEFFWERRPEGVVVKVPHTGFYDRLAQMLFRKPEASRITLDRFGSFVWEQVDGERSVYEIAQLVKQEYGEEAEPLYERIVTYFGILRDNRFINFQHERIKAQH